MNHMISIAFFLRYFQTHKTLRNYLPQIKVDYLVFEHCKFITLNI
jgi:hypothetical protein